jgi:mono/diheme cytochrome c family protein
MSDKKIFGSSALFKDPNAIIAAAKMISSEGYTKWDVNTPYPVHGMDKAMGMKPSKLGLVTLFFGLSGTTLALLLIWWTMSVDYPLVIGGKPFFALPAFIPVTFEVTVLLATVFTIITMFAIFFGLPRNSHPVHDTNYIKKVSVDHFGVIIEAIDPKYDETKIRDLFSSLNAVHTELIYFPEKQPVKIFEPRFIMFLILVAIVVSAGTYVTLNKFMYLLPYNWMDDQAKIVPQSKNDFFADERGMRMPVEGTIARGYLPYPFTGEKEPKEVLSNPYLPTIENLELGKRKFLTFCSPCHGNCADGDSRLQGQFPSPPTLHSTRARNFSDGMIYHIITNGQNAMPSYASQVTRKERWAIINYVRVLQRAKNATDADLAQLNSETGSNAGN